MKMADDVHPAIRRIHEGDGNSPDHIDPQQFRDQQSAKFLLHTPRERVHFLEQLVDAIGRDYSSLKSRAELLDLHREMSRTHKQLLALKR
jgi:hypothetical protein